MPLKSAALFELMAPHLESQGAQLVKKVNAIFFFDIAEKKGGEVTSWTIDLKNGNGALHNGKVGTADATFSLLDADLIAIAAGTLNPQQAFVQGKMKIKGNMAAATKFTPDLLPKTPKL